LTLPGFDPSLLLSGGTAFSSVLFLAETSAVGAWIERLWNIFQVILGLGVVIFVHELGHFLVAKWCGVKCEKFYVGFDVNGWKLWKFQWGETEYGIGAIPLGGYVKMLGQADDPSEQAKENERAKAAAERVDELGAEAPPVHDPRSYMSKSVPQRMAIISAGVIMNVFFALIVGMIAFMMGVWVQPCVVTSVISGTPAWQAGIEVGDEIVQINDIKDPVWPQLKRVVMRGDIQSWFGAPDQPVHVTVKRPGHSQGIKLDPIYPIKMPGSDPIIGVGYPQSNIVNEVRPFADGVPNPGFEGKDRVVAVNDHPVTNYGEIAWQLALADMRDATVKIERTVPNGSPEVKTLTLPKMPLKTLGLIMEIGPVYRVQDGSGAARANLKVGDVVLTLDGQPLGDIFTLPQRLLDKLEQGQKKVTLSVRSGPTATPRDVEVEIEAKPSWIHLSTSQVGGHTFAVAPLGLAFPVSTKILGLSPDFQPAEGTKAEWEAKLIGCEVHLAKFEVPESVDLRPEWRRMLAKPLDFKNASDSVWPYFMTYSQELPPNSQVALTLKKTGPAADAGAVQVEETTVTLPFRNSTLAGYWDRGIQFGPERRELRAETLSEAASLSADASLQTFYDILFVLKKLATREGDSNHVGGPIRIVAAGSSIAADGFSSLLLFLAVLSTNLAVINFLPIPILDGGHMVFLTWEGIYGKPAPENITLWLQFSGLIFILGLFVVVFYLDIMWAWTSF